MESTSAAGIARKAAIASASLVTLAMACGVVLSQAASAQLSLPAPAKPFAGKIEQSFRDSKPDWAPAMPPKPPDGAPNIVLIVLDDVGYGQLGSYGGSIRTDNIDRLAAGGLRYNSFHTASLCSPTRAALLTGRNHHSNAMSTITEAGSGYPGHYGAIPKSSGTIAEVLRQNGYNTFAVGKWHLTPYWETTAAGPYDHWPLGMGFERYYGFLGGEADHWAPALWYDNHRIPTPTRAGYHLSEDLVDKSVEFIRDQQQVGSGRPFFLYLAFGAGHAPHHVPKKHIDRYRGKFDAGWDREREIVLERQKKLGLVPANTVLAPRNPGVKAWESLSADEKRLFARMQEVYAGFVEHTDEQIGRLVQALADMQLVDNTLVIVVSDNGASQEGGPNGTLNTDRFRNAMPMSVAEMLGAIDDIGGPKTDNHYPTGWAMAGNTPFPRWKQDTHRGGTADPFIVHWPQRIREAGGIRTQFHHATDVAPTLLDVAGVRVPASLNGVPQKPIEGVSMAYSFDDAKAPTRKSVQYFEMFGSRALWSDGWMAVAWHRKDTPFDGDRWELYRLDEDFAQANDLAQRHPDKLKDLQDRWWGEAAKYGVLPLDDRRYERAADTTRPIASRPARLYTYYPNTSPLASITAPRVLNRSHRIVADVDIPASGAEGVLICLGSEFGGWSLYVKDRKLVYVHNFLGVEEYSLRSSSDVPAGKGRLEFEFVKTGENVGTGRLAINGSPAGELAGIRTAANLYGFGAEGMQVGRNWGTPVSHDYAAPFAFTGGLGKVVLELQ